MNPDPEGIKREWIIPYDSDLDLGSNAWLSYDEGETGKAQAIIFSSNSDIVKSGPGGLFSHKRCRNHRADSSELRRTERWQDTTPS